MWIRIYFLRIRIQLFFSMQIRIQLISWTKCVKNYLIKGWKRLKIVQKLKTTVWSCSIFTVPHLKKNIINTTVLISFHFFFFPLNIFPSGFRSGSAYWIRIRVQEGKLLRNPIHSPAARLPVTCYIITIFWVETTFRFTALYCHFLWYCWD